MNKIANFIIACCLSFYFLLPDSAEAVMRNTPVPLAIASQALLVSYAATGPALISAQYLVVGGGGGGSYDGGYGGGAGGGGGMVYQGTTNFTPGTNYAITVGLGGDPGQNGQNSSIIGTGVSLTAQGGGGGGISGGSGKTGGNGGGSYNSSYGVGTQGYNGGTGNGNQMGGGGGAGGAGGNGTTSGAGNGGDGVSSTIEGYTFYYGAGGGGGNKNGSARGLGGKQGPYPYTGFGNGCWNSNAIYPAVGGYLNSGSGSGGQTRNNIDDYGNNNSFLGADGVVILAIPTTTAITYTGRYYTSQIGSNYVYKFLSTGTLILQPNGYQSTTRTFTASGTLGTSPYTYNYTLPTGVTSINLLLVGGGGGSYGGIFSNYISGGGGGGVLLIQNLSVSSGATLNIKIGGGGNYNTLAGSTTVTVGGVTYAAAGGGAVYSSTFKNGQNYNVSGSPNYGAGGSGAGGNLLFSTGGSAGNSNVTTNIQAFNNAGGNGYGSGTSSAGGGGGGAGSAGTNATSSTSYGLGGDGYYYSVTGKYYGAGGNGSGYSTGTPGGGKGYGVDYTSGCGACPLDNNPANPNIGRGSGSTGCVVLTYNYGSNALPIHNFQYLLASGTWTCPTGVSSVTAYMVSGGTLINSNEGGNSGSILIKQVSVTPGNNYSYTIGASQTAYGNFGGTTSFAGYSTPTPPYLNYQSTIINGTLSYWTPGQSVNGNYTEYGGGAGGGTTGGTATADDFGTNPGNSGYGGNLGQLDSQYYTSCNVYDYNNPVNVIVGGIGGSGSSDYNNDNAQGVAGVIGLPGRMTPMYNQNIAYPQIYYPPMFFKNYNGYSPAGLGFYFYSSPASGTPYGLGYYYDNNGNFVSGTGAFTYATGAGANANGTASGSGYILLIW